MKYVSIAIGASLLIAWLAWFGNYSRRSDPTFYQPPVAEQELVARLRNRIFGITASGTTMKGIGPFDWNASALVIQHGKRCIGISSAHLTVTDPVSYAEELESEVLHRQFGTPARRSQPNLNLTYTLTDCHGTTFSCSLIRADVKTDVATFALEPTAVIATDTLTPEQITDAQDGDLIFFCGLKQVIAGHCRRCHPRWNLNYGCFWDMVHAQAATLPGFSGGPVFNRFGKVLGICTGGKGDYSVYTQASSLRTALALLP